MKKTTVSLLALLLALLLCCGFATAALAAGGAPVAAETETEAGDAALAAGKGYTLREDTEIEQDTTPLAAGPVETHCVLHVLLFLLSAAVGVYFLYSRQKHRARQRELLARLRS